MNSYEPYKAYTSYDQVLVAYSALKAGGFNPIFQNLNTAQLNMFEALALGGYWIFLPQNQHTDAKEWQSWLRKQAIKDTDSYVPSKSYWGTAFFTSLATFNIIAFPLLLCGWIFEKLYKRQTI